VLAAVFVDGIQREHHYSNRVAGHEIDLTADQFDGAVTFERLAVLSDDEITARADAIRPELVERISLLRAAVHRLLVVADGLDGSRHLTLGPGRERCIGVRFGTVGP
jgi:hypothetical protein